MDVGTFIAGAVVGVIATLLVIVVLAETYEAGRKDGGK